MVIPTQFAGHEQVEEGIAKIEEAFSLNGIWSKAMVAVWLPITGMTDEKIPGHNRGHVFRVCL